MKHQINVSDILDVEIWNSKGKLGLEIRWQGHQMWVVTEARELNVVLTFNE